MAVQAKNDGFFLFFSRSIIGAVGDRSRTAMQLVRSILLVALFLYLFFKKINTTILCSASAAASYS